MKTVPTRAVNIALLTSTGFSLLSVIIFGIYLIGRFLIQGTAQDFLGHLILAGTVLAGVAQIWQFVAVALVLVAWFTLKSMPKSRRELIILVLSLIPFVPVLILMVVAVLYLRARFMRMEPDRRQDLLGTQKDVGIDVASTLAGQLEVPIPSAMGGTGTGAPPLGSPATLPIVAPAPSIHGNIHSIIRSVVGPVTSDTLTKTPAAMLGTLAVVTVLSVSALGATTRIPPTTITPAHISTHFPTGTVKLFAAPRNPIRSRPIWGPDGNLWFPEASKTSDPKVGRMTPTGSIQEFIDTGAGAFIHEIVVGPDGNLWCTASGFTTTVNSLIQKVTTQGRFTSYLLDGVANSLTTASDGNLWYTSNNLSNAYLGSISPAGKVGKEIMITPPASGYGAYKITTGAKGTLWFSLENATSQAGDDWIGYATLSGTIKEFYIPGSGNNDLSSVAFGPDGNLWFTLYSRNLIGRITPTGSIKEFPVPQQSQPEGITAGPDGNLWFTEAQGLRIGRITPAGDIREFPTGVASYDITRGGDRTLWFDGTVANNQPIIGRISP